MSVRDTSSPQLDQWTGSPPCMLFREADEAGPERKPRTWKDICGEKGVTAGLPWAGAQWQSPMGTDADQGAGRGPRRRTTPAWPVDF